MGILDNLAGAVGGGGQEGIMDAIGGLVGGNGLSGLVENFSKAGLGDTISSWIGSGSNLPISADQIQSVLGSEQLQGIAAKLGISAGEASSGIASLLPQAIDALTPDGKVPDGGVSTDGIGGLLKGLGL